MLNFHMTSLPLRMGETLLDLDSFYWDLKNCG